MKNSLSCHKHVDPSNSGNLYHFYLLSVSDKKMLNLIFSPNFGIFIYKVLVFETYIFMWYKSWKGGFTVDPPLMR